MQKPLCRHCHSAVVGRPRGLCWHCYYVAGVRELYPSTSIYGQRGVPDRYGVLPPPAEPTAFLPGSAGKVRVMRQRAEAGTALWHPGDAGYSRSGAEVA